MALGRCLVLNNSYELLDICDWFDAICLLVEKKATPLSEYNDVVRSQHITWNVPSVLLMNYYVRSKKRSNTYKIANKRNILVRDKFKCQYCGEKLSMKTATIDHVHPRSKGGENTIENCIASCKKCNNAKGDTALSVFEQSSGLKLTSKPRHLTDVEKIDCLLKTVKSKERDAWIRCMDDLKLTLY
jgi:5-methylcytosine-specific restriction endonuclease McrA